LRLTYHTATIAANPHRTKAPRTPSTISNDGDRPSVTGFVSGALAVVVVVGPAADDVVVIVELSAFELVVIPGAPEVVSPPVVVGDAADDDVGIAFVEVVCGPVEVGIAVVEGNAVPHASVRCQLKWYSNK